MVMLFFYLACASSQDVNIEINGNTQTQNPSEPEDLDTDEASDLNISTEGCDDAPMVTWDNWVESMIITHCQGCHASSSPNRYGAPLEIHFDHKEAAYDLADRIYIRTLEQEDMPPAGGILEEDLYLLDIWLRCSVGL